MKDSRVSVDVRLPPGWASEEMKADIIKAFSDIPVVLPPKWLYDDRGSELFDLITRLPEYYPTEAERELLQEKASRIAELTEADTVVELGSGTSDKTRTLLDAFYRQGQLQKFCPVDVSEATVVDAAHSLAERYPGIEVAALVGDFTRHLRYLPKGKRRLVAFLGGTIGNFYSDERQAFFRDLSDELKTGEWFLLGFDPIKSVNKILAAYDDDQGVTATFVTNVLSVLNKKFDANFDPTNFDYVPFWDGREKRVDLRLRVQKPGLVSIGALELEVPLTEGQEIRVEVSNKFDPGHLAVEVEQFGFEVADQFVGNDDAFGLLLARRI